MSGDGPGALTLGWRAGDEKAELAANLGTGEYELRYTAAGTRHTVTDPLEIRR